MNGKLTSATAVALMMLTACGSSADDARAVSADASTVPTSTTTTTAAPPTTTPTPGREMPRDTVATSPRAAVTPAATAPATTTSLRSTTGSTLRRVPGSILLPTHGLRQGDIIPAGPGWAPPDIGITGDVDTGCVWLTSPDGHRWMPLWDEGFQATFNPLIVYNGQGEVIWRAGERYSVQSGTANWARDRVPANCRLGPPPHNHVVLTAEDSLGPSRTPTTTTSTGVLP